MEFKTLRKSGFVTRLKFSSKDLDENLDGVANSVQRRDDFCGRNLRLQTRKLLKTAHRFSHAVRRR